VTAITWADVMKRRCERQRRKRQSPLWRPWKLWVAYFDQPLMGGWHTFLEDWRGRDSRVWIDRDRRHIRKSLMGLFPLILPLEDEDSDWRRWQVEFARTYQRRTQHGRPLGVAHVRWDGLSWQPRTWQ
jgi:hypothetical protein